MMKLKRESLLLAFAGLVLAGCPYSLTVTIEPPAAVAAGAQWQVDGGPPQVSDAVVPDLTEGAHVVSFMELPGWIAPPDQEVSISANVGTYATGVYQLAATKGSVTVFIGPQEAVNAGAQFQINGTWRDSGTAETLGAGVYTVSFKPVAGWTTPPDRAVTIIAGEMATVTAAYGAPVSKGSLQAVLSPAGAVAAGAQWRVDSGPLNNSGVTVQNLDLGAHTVSFAETAGWVRPPDQTVTVAANQTTMVAGVYTERATTGSLAVTLRPPEAVTAGAKWQVDGGTLRASGAIESGLTPGTHVIAFAQASGWITPAGQTVTITAGAPTAAEGVYTPQVLTGSHAGRFVKYEGSKTCQQCHPNEVRDMHASVHYQWKGDTPYVTNLESGGKLGNINDFCTYPDISWISKLTNVDGKLVDGGCAQCHVGMGEKPLAEATQAQLENVDCLVCHADSYKRKVEKVGDVLKFVPAPEKMTVSELQAITDIHLPTNDGCLDCHSSSGGGDNNKRGDLTEGHRNPSPMLDVHLASRARGGAGLLCTDCHVTEAHRVAGRGVDLRPTDLDVDIGCASCHGAQPHHEEELDKHTTRVDCASCHIPRFAKITSTDMLRDFSAPADLLVDKRLYEPHMEREANVIPEYQFFDGFSQFYGFGEPAVPGDDGYVLMAGPAPAVAGTPGAKIAPMKRHKGVMAVDVASQALIPLKMGILFQTGNVDMAIRRGASDVGWPLNQGYGFVDVERHMGLYHEVQPKEQALTCNDCHYGATRMDFDALGYQRKPTRQNKPLCASCHKDESGEWRPSELFKKVHEKHVKDKRIDCIECHYFRK